EEHGPELVVLAARGPGLAEALAATARALQSPPLILLVEDPSSAWTARIRRAGARAVLGRDASAPENAAAFDAAAAGLIALDPDVFRPGARGASDRAEDRALTAREREILEAMAEGLSNRAIARRLGISAHTVKFHVAAILDKTGARTRTEAVTLGV